MIAAINIPIFLLMFAIVFPALGFDVEKFFEAENTLAFFAAQPAVIRLTGLANMTTMTGPMVLMLALAFRMWKQEPVPAVLGGRLGI